MFDSRTDLCYACGNCIVSKFQVRLNPDVRRIAGEVGESPTLSRNGNDRKIRSPKTCLNLSS